MILYFSRNYYINIGVSHSFSVPFSCSFCHFMYFPSFQFYLRFPILVTWFTHISVNVCIYYLWARVLLFPSVQVLTYLISLVSRFPIICVDACYHTFLHLSILHNDGDFFVVVEHISPCCVVKTFLEDNGCSTSIVLVLTPVYFLHLIFFYYFHPIIWQKYFRLFVYSRFKDYHPFYFRCHLLDFFCFMHVTSIAWNPIHIPAQESCIFIIHSSSQSSFHLHLHILHDPYILHLLSINVIFPLLLPQKS